MGVKIIAGDDFIGRDLVSHFLWPAGNDAGGAGNSRGELQALDVVPRFRCGSQSAHLRQGIVKC